MRQVIIDGVFVVTMALPTLALFILFEWLVYDGIVPHIYAVALFLALSLLWCFIGAFLWTWIQVRRKRRESA